MANNNEESTMKFKVDIADLKAGMKEAQRAVTMANSEFKAATAGMDNWGKSADGVGAKLTQLDTNLKTQKTVLANLEKQYELTANEMGEGSKAAQDLMVKINNQKAAIGKTESEITKYTNSLNEIEASSKEADSAVGKLTKTINDQESELTSLKNEYANVSLELGSSSKEAQDLENQIKGLSNELSNNKSKLNEATGAFDNLDQSINDTKGEATQLEGGFTVLKGALASLAADAIKSVISGMREMATASDSAAASFQAATGVSNSAAKEYQAAMEDLYKNNYGESLQDVASAMAKVKQQMRDLDSTQVESMTKNLLALQDTFDMDFNETLRGVTGLMQNMGLTADQAFDLMAKGAQNGLNKSDELGDNIAEYSQLWGQAGFSAEEMFEILQNGLDSGAYNLDKVNDLVKEMGISLSDGRVEESLSSWSTETQSLFKSWQNGGASQADVIKSLINDLAGMENQQEALTLASNTWSALGEDNAMDVITSLNKVSGTYSDVEGAMKKVNDVKYSDVQSQFQQLGRTIMTDVFTPMAKELLPIAKDFVSFITHNMPLVENSIKAVGAVLATVFVVKTINNFKSGIVGLGAELLKLGAKSIPMIGTALTSLGTILMAHPLLALAGVIAGVTTAVILASKEQDNYNSKLKEEADAATEAKKSWDEMTEAKQKAQQEAVSEIDYQKSLKDELMNLVDANGKVKEGYEARANFIVGELNSAYGTEIQMIGGVIQEYQTQMEVLDQLMEKQRAKAIIDAGQEAYTVAVQNRTKALQEQAEAEETYAKKKAEWEKYKNELLADGWEEEDIIYNNRDSALYKDYINAETNYNKKKELAEGYTDTISQQEYLQKLYASGSAEDIAKINEYVAKTYDDKGKKVVLSTTEQINNETDLLNYLKKRKQETNSDMYDDQINASEQRLKQLNEDLQGQKSTVEAKTPENMTVWEMFAQAGVNGFGSKAASFNSTGASNANEAKKGAASKNGEMNTTGAGLAGGLVNGIGSKILDGTLYTSGSNAGNKVKSGADSVDTAPSGTNLSQGLINGATAPTIWASLLTTGINIATRVLSGVKTGGREGSPWKTTIQSGKWAAEGLAIGVEEESNTVARAGVNLANSLTSQLGTLKSQVANGVSNVNANIGGNVALAGNGSGANNYGGTNVVYNQYNNSPKSLSNFEIYRQTNRLLFNAKVRGDK